MMQPKAHLASETLYGHKFLALLQKNRASDVQRKRFLEGNHKDLRTKSFASNDFLRPSRKAAADREKKIEAVTRLIFRSKHQDLKKAKDLKALKDSLSAQKKKILAKVSGSTTKRLEGFICRRASTPAETLKLKQLKSPLRIRNIQLDRNFCDFYSTFTPRAKEPEGFGLDAPDAYIAPFLTSLNNEVIGRHCQVAKSLKALPSPQPKSGRGPHPATAPKKKAGHNRIRSVLCKERFDLTNFKLNAAPLKANPRDSVFLSQFFKLQNQLCDKNQSAFPVDKRLAEEIDTFVKRHYKSYWMMSIEDLLAQDVIEHLNHGYYKYKSISFGPFKLMSVAEKILYKVHEDIAREKLTLFNSKLGDPSG